MPQSDPQPPIDDHIATPETREEYIDGHRVYAQPARLEHAATHAELDYVLRANAAPGYLTTSDMLTRTSDKWDFAADAAILKRGVNPETGTRYLEELAFEVKFTQRMSDLTRRAEQLVGRGVRRVFVICVEEGEEVDEVLAGPVLEWSPQARRWNELSPDSTIEDPCLRRPLAVRALLDAIEADNAVARALLDKGNPVLREHEAQAAARALEQGIEQGLEQGLEQGTLATTREAIHDLCELLDIEVSAERRARIKAMSIEELQALRRALKSDRRWP